MFYPTFALQNRPARLVSFTTPVSCFCKICKNTAWGKCRYGAKCQVAHGKEELHRVARCPKCVFSTNNFLNDDCAAFCHRDTMAAAAVDLRCAGFPLSSQFHPHLVQFTYGAMGGGAGGDRGPVPRTVTGCRHQQAPTPPTAPTRTPIGARLGASPMIGSADHVALGLAPGDAEDAELAAVATTCGRQSFRVLGKLCFYICFAFCESLNTIVSLVCHFTMTM